MSLTRTSARISPSRTWDARVGFSSAEIGIALLGQKGCLEYLDAKFCGARQLVELETNSSFRGSTSAATITVTTTADDITPNDGSVSLREAITAINAGNDLGDPDIVAENPGSFGANDTIKFSQPGQINVANSALPNIVQPMMIQGTMALGAPSTVLNGSGAGPNANGLDIQLGAQVFSSGVTIEGLVINNFSGNGIVVGPNNVTGPGLNPVVITRNYIGTNAAATAVMANQQSGILIDATNSNNSGLSASNSLITINVISGNGQDGVRITASNGVAAGNTLTANFIGGNDGSTALLPNGGDGVFVAASGNNIGNNVFGNTVTDNGGVGIHIAGTLSNPATGNVVANNFVGDAGMPNAALGNQSFGIEVSGGTSNLIGGNIVDDNSDGIELDSGAQNNIVQGNAVVANKLHGIALRSDDNLTPPLGPGQPNEPGVRNNLIGGAGAGDVNTIAANGLAGVAVFGNPLALSGQAN